MPHYKDGTEAKVGDMVKGQPYNTPHEVIGVVTGITPSMDTCNLRVSFLRPRRAHEHTTLLGVVDHCPEPSIYLVALDTDSGETGAFELVHRAEPSPPL